MWASLGAYLHRITYSLLLKRAVGRGTKAANNLGKARGALVNA